MAFPSVDVCPGNAVVRSDLAKRTGRISAPLDIQKRDLMIILDRENSLKSDARIRGKVEFQAKSSQIGTNQCNVFVWN